MMQELPQRQKPDQKRRALIPLLILLLLSLMVSGVLAQEGPDAQAEDGISWPDNGDIYVPDEANATAQEAWIRVTEDAFVSSNDPNRNFGLDSLVRFGFAPGGLGATRPMFFFDLRSAIPSTARISYAEFQIYLTSNTDPDTSRGYAAHSLTQSWQEPFVTWNNQPAWGPEIGRGTLGNNPGWQTTDITSLARDWQSNPGGNNGIILVGDERPDQNFERAYFSKESSSNLFPRLYVRFDNSVDDRAPEARVTNPTAGSWSPADFQVRWEGNDPPNSDGSPGSGIRWYDVFYTNNNGANWRVGRAQVTSTTTNVNGASHLSRLGFYARARDNAGNEGPSPSGSGSVQTWTIVDAEPPNATMNPLPDITTTPNFTVSWFDNKEGQESGIQYYDVQFREEGGSWQQLVYHTTATSANFNQGRDGVTYEFRARGVDNVGNEQPWGDAQASTTVWQQAVAFIVPFDPPVYQKLDGPAPGDGFTVSWDAFTPPGVSVTAYEVRYRRPGTNAWVSWLSGTTQKSAQFNLAQNDPDGVYTFQVRATSSTGVTGPFIDELQGQIIVDRIAPFVETRSAMPAVFGDVPVSGFTSGQQIQNTGNAPTDTLLQIFDQTGLSTNCGAQRIAPGASVTYLTDTDCLIPSSFVGSAIASADQPVAAIVNVNNRGTGAAAGQYQGTEIDAAAETLYFPLVKHDHSNRTTTFYVQNVSDTSNNISAVFSVNGINYTWSAFNVPAYATVIVDPADTVPPVPAGQGNVGSAIFTGTQPLAGSSLEHEHNVPVPQNLQASKAFTDADGAETVYCPLYRNNHTAKGQTTGAQVQNIGNQQADVEFTVNAGGLTYGPYFASIPAGSSHTFYAPSLANPALPAGVVGSATITSDQPVVALVNDRGTDQGFDFLTSYACFSEGSTEVNVPLAKEFTGGNTTGVQVQNAGSNAARATLAYRSTDGRTLTIETRNPIQPGQSVTAWGISNYPDATWRVTSGIASTMANSVNGVTATSNQPLTVIANESSSGPNPSGQDTKNYEGFGK